MDIIDKKVLMEIINLIFNVIRNLIIIVDWEDIIKGIQDVNVVSRTEIITL